MSVTIQCHNDERCARAHTTDAAGRQYHVDFVGAVLRTRERNFQDDSEFYAIVWDGERVTTVEYGYTGLGGSDFNHAEADATPEVREAAGAWAEAYMRPDLEAEADRDAAEPAYTKRVRVTNPPTRGKNVVPAGTEGMVFWVGDVDASGRGRYTTRRVGVLTDEGRRFFIDAHRVEVIDPAQYRVSNEQVESWARIYRAHPENVALRWAARSGMVVL